MPHTLVQLEYLKPVVERLDCLTAPCVETLSFPTLEELQSREPAAVMFVTRDRLVLITPTKLPSPQCKGRSGNSRIASNLTECSWGG